MRGHIVRKVVRSVGYPDNSSPLQSLRKVEKCFLTSKFDRQLGFRVVQFQVDSVKRYGVSPDEKSPAAFLRACDGR